MDLRPQSVLHSLAGGFVCLAMVAGAQTTTTETTPNPSTSTTTAPAAAPAAAPVWSAGSIDFSGFVDGYYSYDFNRPASQTNQLYNFDDSTGFSLEAAKLTMNHDADPIGAHVDLLWGRTNAFLHSSSDQTDNFVEQAYISIKPPKAKGFELDAGQFVTSAGQEVIETMNNWSYSHGILFGYAIPYYHFGLRTTMPVTKAWTAGVQLVNGWNNVVDNNGGVTVGLTSSLVKPKYTWNLNYYTGPENSGTQKGYRNLIDTTLLLTPTSKFSWYINYDYGQNHAPATQPLFAHSPHWQGIATSARGQITPNSALVARYEHFNDNQGFSTGTTQTLNEFTATYEYKWAAGLLMRSEYRRDSSDQAFFSKGDTRFVKAQSTVTMGLIAFFGPKR
ncbi:MAG TPA: porin [Acidobacteriaceae bacterium]|nr:porin [Acidobacteriaceae bacterium]